MHRSPYADALERLADFQAQMALLQGNQPAMAQWVRICNLAVGDDLTYANRGRYLLFARWLIDQQRISEAQPLLNRLRHFATQLGLLGNEIEVLVLQARLAQVQGNGIEAITLLQEALTLAEPEGYVRLFLRQGEALCLLLAELGRTRSESRLRTYIDHLLAAFGHGCPAESDTQTPVSPQLVNLLEPLSERELHVLHLLAAGASNQAIAEELVIALTTAKKHVSNIIGKLGVENRSQAVARARALGLLS